MFSCEQVTNLVYRAAIAVLQGDPALTDERCVAFAGDGPQSKAILSVASQLFVDPLADLVIRKCVFVGRHDDRILQDTGNRFLICQGHGPDPASLCFDHKMCLL